MDTRPCAHEVGALYRELYALAVRRVDDGRDGLHALLAALSPPDTTE